jgi:hypothetical protein
MADEPEIPENEDELLLTEEVEPQEPAEEPEEPTGETDEEEEVFSFGDEPTEPQEGDSGLVKHLRDQLRKEQKEKAELRQQIKASPADQPIEVGEKPTLAGCDFDEETFERELDAWKERDRQAKEQVSKRDEAARAQQKQWEDMLSEVAHEKQELARPDADDAFETVRATLGDQMNALLIHTVDKGNRAKLIYALGQNPGKLQALAQANGATDPIRFIKLVATLEKELKVVKRRKAPEPDTPSRPSAGASVKVGAVQKQLEKMEADWEKRGGDRSHIQKFKRENGLLGK